MNVVLYTLRSFRTGASPSDTIQSHTLDTPFRCYLKSLQRKQYILNLTNKGVIIYRNHCKIITPVCIYPTPPPQEKWYKIKFLIGVQIVWIQSIPSTRLNVEPRITMNSQYYYLPITGWENNWINTFPKSIWEKRNSFDKNLNSGHWFHITIIVSLSTPL